MKRLNIHCVVGGIVALLAITSQTVGAQDRPLSKQQQELLKLASARNAGWSTEEQDLWKLSSSRHQAMIDHDGDFVLKIAGKEFLYGHAGGNVDGLAPFVAYVRKSLWLSILQNDLKPAIYGNVGVLIGKLKVKLNSKGNPASGINEKGEYFAQVSETWVKRDGRWQWLYYQATPVPVPQWASAAEVHR